MFNEREEVVTKGEKCNVYTTLTHKCIHEYLHEFQQFTS